MPDRPIIDVFDTSGDLRVRIGDISGRAWGGAGFVLPEGTFGLWTDREGAWLRGNVTMFYANSRSATVSSGLTAANVGGTYTFVATVDETFPFGTIKIPAGRIITMEMFLHSMSATLSGGGTTWIGVGAVLNSLRFRGSRAGAAEQDFDFLSGPTTGDVTYASLKLRLVYHVSGQAQSAFDGLLTWSATRVASIRMFAHEIHANTTVALISQVFQAGGGSGRSFGMEVGISGTDQGGGTGGDAVTVPGDAPGGPFV